MRTRSILTFACSTLLGWGVVACNQTPQAPQTPQGGSNAAAAPAEPSAAKADVNLQDYGPAPTVLNIDAYTTTNTNFRTALWTGTKLQVTLMSIPVGGEVGLEQHPDTDQFLRVEEGQAKVLMGDAKDSLTFTQTAQKDFAILVPAGKWHNIINTGDQPLKLYSIYAPPHHPHGTIHKTHEEAEAAEAAEAGQH